MGIVTISGEDYDIYGSLDGANLYLAARLGAAAWATATDTIKGQALVTASRLIQNYLVSCGYDIEPEESESKSLAQADYELAYGLFVDPGLQDQIQGAVAAKRRVKAGSAEVEYFASASLLNKQASFPSIVQSLLNKWIKIQAGSTGFGIAIPYASGTCERSTLVPNGSQISGFSDCGCAGDALPYSSGGGAALDIDDVDDGGSGGGPSGPFTADSILITADSIIITADAV